METDCRICVLPDLLVKKIAAGEVVERPASVVKELIENAIDAGAKRISVRLADGGRQLIRVTDDGCGMSAQGLQLAVAPHATSKLYTEDDLYRIGTLGFRGEALASISAVSKLRIVSRREGDVEGHEIRVVAQDVQSSRAAGCPAGTTVEVRDLFFNVPARRKFLRTTATEMGHVQEQFARVALAHPSIAFELSSESRVLQNLPAAGSRIERISRFYGDELAAALISIQRNERGVRLEAYVAPPAQSRATAQWQYTFVNGRYVRDRFVQHAIKEAYRGLVDPNRHAVVFLFVTIDPADVDVNVHPTKIEVRWADSGLIHSQVLSALRETFQRHDLTVPLRTGQHGWPAVSEGDQERIRQETAAWLKSATPIRPGSESDPGPQFAGHAEQAPSAEPIAGGARSTQGDPLTAWRALYGGAPDAGDRNDDSGEAQRSKIEDRREEPFRSSDFDLRSSPAPRAIQVHNLYLVAETEDGILIVDQHALHERVLYEALRERITTGPLESQRLLLPETIRVTSQQQALLEEHRGLMQRLGIEVNPFGPDSIAVQGFPALLKDTDVVPFMRDLLDLLSGHAASMSADEVLDRLLSMAACKAAVKAGDPLRPEEIEALFAHKELIDKPSNCPHGRPTMLRLTRADLDRQFQRR